MYLEVLSPGKTVFSGNIKIIKVPGTGGSFEVMKNHAPLISTLDDGKVRIVAEDDTTRLFNISGGVIQVIANKIIVLAESITDSK